MIDLIVLFCYLAIILLVGLWAGRDVSSIKDYSTSERGFGSLVIFATLSASFIGGGFSTGNAEKVFLFGIANIVALWGFSCKEIFVAKQIAPRMARFKDAISVGDIMAPAYGKTGRIVTGLCGLALCCGIVGAQVGAVGYVFQNIFEIDRLVGIVIGCGIVIIYTTVGGMKSVIYTDILQFVLLGAGLPLALILGIIEIGGIDALTAGIPSDHLTLPGPGVSWTGLAALFVVFMLGETLVPPYMQRLLAGRSSGDVARGTLYSGIFSIPFFTVTGSIGLVALVLNPDINPNMAMPYVLNTVLPPFLKGLLFAAVISIVMSSADSFLNSAGIAFVNDVYKPLVRQPPSDRKLLIIAKTVTVVVGVMSIVFAVSIESIIDLVIHAYQYWAPVVLVPLVATIYGYERGSRAFIAAAIVGASATFIWSTILRDPGAISGIIIGVLSNLTIFVLFPASKSPDIERN